MKQEIWHGDCLELMKNIPNKSVDLVLTTPLIISPEKITFILWAEQE